METTLKLYMVDFGFSVMLESKRLILACSPTVCFLNWYHDIVHTYA